MIAARWVLHVSAAAVLICGTSRVAPALEVVETELVAETPGPADGDFFGSDVGLLGDYAVVGSPYLDSSPAKSGYVHVYVRADGSWSHEATLVPSYILQPGDAGISVGIDLDPQGIDPDRPARIISGNRSDRSATVWKRIGTTWTEEHTWLSGVAQFGNSAAIYANHAVIGTEDADKMFAARYNGTNWSSVAELDATAAVGVEKLGYDVDVDGQWIIGGAHASNSDDGAVCFWRFNDDSSAWEFHSQIDGEAAAAGMFGISCDLDGGRAVIGAPAFNGNDGKAYIYGYNSQTDTWEQEAALGGDAASGELLGSGVRLDGERAVIGACGADITLGDTTYTDAGAAYVYRFNGTDWSLEGRIAAEQPVDGQTLGSAVDIDGNGDGFLLGGPFSEGDTRLHGAAMFFEPAIPGDANKDGMVTDADAAILATNWQQQTGATWAGGDFNGDGKVTDADAAILATHWQEDVPEAAAPVPEPAMLALIAIVGLSLAILYSRGRLAPAATPGSS